MADLLFYTNPQSRGQTVRWMLEELRVSSFAQTLGTPRPVSEQRIRKALAAIREPSLS